MMNNKQRCLIFFFVTILYVIIPILRNNGNLSCTDPRFTDSRVCSTGSSSLFAQDKSRDAKIKASDKEIKDKRGEIIQDESGMLIKVMAVVLIVWIGIAAFMIKINIKIVKLEREINDL